MRVLHERATGLTLMLTDCDQTKSKSIIHQQSILIHIQAFCFKIFPELRIVGKILTTTFLDSDEN